MIFQRKIYNKFLNWKEESCGKKALLVEGARRIGKSTIVEEFVKQEYKSYIFIDFAKAREAIKYLVADGRYDFIETGSLLKFRDKFRNRIGECYIIHPRNLTLKDDILCIPPYMAICL